MSFVLKIMHLKQYIRSIVIVICKNICNIIHVVAPTVDVLKIQGNKGDNTMKKLLPKHVSYGPDRKKGPYIYFAKDGRRKTMPGRYPFDTSSSEFWAQYAHCMAGNAGIPVSHRTLGELIKLYRASAAFKSLRAKTSQKNYNYQLEWLDAKAGHVLVKSFKRPDIIAMRDSRADKPPTANFLLTVTKCLFEEGCNKGWIEHNPCAGVKKIKTRNEFRQPWSEDDIARFHEIADDRSSLILELAVNTGQRIADVLQLRWDAVVRNNQAGGKLGTWVTQEKTEKRLFVVFSQRLCAILIDTDQQSEYIVHNTKRSGPMKYGGVENVITALRNELGIKKTIHDWRHTCAHRLAAAGCQSDRIKAITGHSSTSMVEHYANETLQITQAVSAIKALDALEEA